LALRSEEFNVSGTWGSLNSTQVSVNVSATLDPAGGNNADLIFCQASGTAAQGFNQSIAVSVSGTYTMSVFVKKAVNFDWFRIQFQDPASAVHQVYYNLVSGTLGTVSSGSTGTITNYGNGWYRVTHSRSITSGTVAMSLRLASADNLTTVVCDGNSGTYVWGAQVETGSVATSYIPTTTAAVTRNADVISVTGAVSGSIGQTEGTIYAEVDVRNITALKAIIQLDNGTGDNRLLIQISSPNTLTFFSSNGGSVSTIATGSISTGTHKIAASYSSGNVEMYMDGSFLTSGSMVNYPSLSLTNVSIGSRIFSAVQGNFLNDRIRAAALYTTRLTNAQLAALTTP
jgi:hypothetical protein